MIEYITNDQVNDNWIIVPKYENWTDLGNIKDNHFQVLFARLLGLDYPTFLRFCRDMCNATLLKDDTGFGYPVFHRGEGLYRLTQLLNARATLLMYEREHRHE